MKLGYGALWLCVVAAAFLGAACSNGGTMSGDSAADSPAPDVSTGNDAARTDARIDVAPADSSTDSASSDALMDAVSRDGAAMDAPADGTVGDAPASDTTLSDVPAMDTTSSDTTSSDTGSTDASEADGSLGDATGPDVAVDAGMLSGSATCAMATVVTPGTMVIGDTAVGTDVSTACNSGEGGQVYFSITVPAQSSLVVTVTPDPASGNDVDVRVLTECGATACYYVQATLGGPTAYGLSSPGTTATTYIVSVSNEGGGTASDSGFTLAVSTVSTVPYTVTSITASCDDMSAATLVSGPDADDGASANAALPFAFTSFGASVVGYTMTSNGFAQLWPDLTSVGDIDFDNAPFPTGGGSVNGGGDMLGAVAPFWDDLNGTATGTITPTATVETFGTAPTRHLTLQWEHYYFFDDDTADLTFQLKFFETTNVIEVHYCSMIEGTTQVTQASGDSATVGIQNLSATVGVTVVSNTAGAVATGGGFSFTPSP